MLSNLPWQIETCLFVFVWSKHRRKRCFNLQLVEGLRAFACWWIPQTYVPTMWGWLMSKLQASWSVCVMVSHTQHVNPSCSLLALSSNWLRFQSATMNTNLACSGHHDTPVFTKFEHGLLFEDSSLVVYLLVISISLLLKLWRQARALWSP